MSTLREHQLQILRYWRNVEFLRVFDVDKVIERRKPNFLLYRHTRSDTLPWYDLERAGLNSEYEYSFDLFFAPFLIAEIFHELSEFVPQAAEPLPEYRAWEIPGQSCVGRIAINSKGLLDPVDFALSTLPWAVHTLTQQRQLSIKDFDQYAHTLQQEIEGMLVDLAARQGLSAGTDMQILNAICEHVSKLCNLSLFPNDLIGVAVPIRLKKREKIEAEIAPVENDLEADYQTEELIENDVAIESEQERKDRRKRRKVDILNSFYLRDLERAAATEIEKFSPTLSKYLAPPIGAAERADIRISPSARAEVDALAAIERLGAWPVSASISLSTNQNAAINWMLLDHTAPNFKPLIAVNGPPGTGKTTLIRDLVAALVVKRASILSRLESPQAAFEEAQYAFSPEGKEISYRFRMLKTAFKGFGIVIASSNNGAVENVSKELPSLDVLDTHFREFRYLAEVTRSYRYACQVADVGDWWGLVSLPLGKSLNRREAALGLFWGEQDEIKKSEREALGALTLREWRNKAPPEGTLSFKDAQKYFISKLKDVQNCVQHSETFALANRHLFLAALSLQESWLREVPGFEKELKSLASLLSRPNAIPPYAAQELWEILFMISPLVSTTLASVENMFGSLGPNKLPHVVIDEAGQALSQAAVGILLRAKRALILGDQQQLKPILSMPYALDEYLQAGLVPQQVTDFCASLTSVQSLGDNQTHLGTLLNSNEEGVWIGLPLDSHRRCDQPMFAISNSIAYDNMMVFDTPARAPIKALGESCWINIKGNVSRAQWVPDQGVALQHMLTALLQREPNPDCFFISPFREVGLSLRDLVRATIKSAHPHSSLGDQLARRVGTIHTFQGREADIVFLVLGCDGTREGAADWAGAAPNLCNVAITRARRFIYVIGDVDLWHRRGVFSDLQKALPVKQLDGFLSGLATNQT